MKFRDPKTGEVFEDIEAERLNLCKHPCCECPLNCDTIIKCPAEAARLMGYEVVESLTISNSEIKSEKGHSDSYYAIREGAKDWPEYKINIFNNNLPAHGKAIEKEDTMDKTNKPRICEVLGVEVGEVFTADTPYGRFQRCVIDEEGQILNTGTNILCYILNHPGCIIRKPRFTQEEVADASVLCRALGPGWMARDGDSGLWYHTAKPEWVNGDFLRKEKEDFMVPIQDDMFPSLRPGQPVELEDIIGEDTE